MADTLTGLQHELLAIRKRYNGLRRPLTIEEERTRISEEIPIVERFRAIGETPSYPAGEA